MPPTKTHFGTSTSMMRTAVAFVMAVMLVSIATVCPAIACPLGQVSGTQSRSCCHQPQPQPTSCPRTTIQSCPYLELRYEHPSAFTSRGFDQPPQGFLDSSSRHVCGSSLPDCGRYDAGNRYLSLEKSTAATTTPDAVSLSLTPVVPDLLVLNRHSSFGIEDRLPNSAGLFLRIRVLLI